MDDEYAYDDQAYDNQAYDEYAPEGDGGEFTADPGLPEQHWGRDPEWLKFGDSLVAELYRDEALYESFKGWLESHYGEQGEPSEPQHFAGLHDPKLRESAREFLERGNAQRRGA